MSFDDSKMKKLGFGLMRLPRLEKNGGSEIDIEQTKQMVDRFISAGFNYFDTAWMYCSNKCEGAVKEFLTSRYERDEYMLATKLPFYMIRDMADRDKIFSAQLEKTGVDYFDCYLIHEVNAVTLKTFDRFDCFNWLREKKEQGLAKAIGFSFHDGPRLLDKLLYEHPYMDVVQLQINYLDWENAAVQSRACYEIARKHNKQIIVMEPIKGGMLANVPPEVERMLKEQNENMSVASWALRFAAGLPGVVTVLSGMSDMEQLSDNISYMKELVPLTEKETATVRLAADMINRSVAVPCTGCEYCMVDCPAGIPIPKYFSLYNADLQERSCCERTWTSHEGYYESLAAACGKASDCLKCGKCEEICPQHLKIRELLERVAEHFE